MHCRHCEQELTNVFLDLGIAPHSNAYRTLAELSTPEPKYPLKLYVCSKCWLVQTQDVSAAVDLFSPFYPYFSSISMSWLDHAHHYVEMITSKLSLNADSFVIEIASNDGYLLKNFVSKGIPCLGIEPTKNTAQAARASGIAVCEKFFGNTMAYTLPKADLIIGNNVYAHVPDINDFTRGLKTALKDTGTITLEFPHLLELIKYNQFDTVYHEHFSYLSFFTVQKIFQASGLRIFDVERLSTHGGSLRIYGCHAQDVRKESSSVSALCTEEEEYGLQNLSLYQEFQAKADKVRDDFVSFLQDEKLRGRKVAGYGAAAKGNTLLNYAGIQEDMISFVCDAAPSKQGKFLPGSHIPVFPPSEMKLRKPDTIIIFPWNIKEEVKTQLSCVREWGATFVTAIPRLKMEEA